MKPIHTKNRRIGLLGGTFDPAHAGHLHLSKEALKTLKLDAVWWLVTPQNPLKPAAGTSYQERLESAQRIIKGQKNILVSDIEQHEKCFYSVDTIAMLKRRFPGTQFIWLMGADNLAGLHRWKNWRAFLAQIPVAVFDRAPFSHTALRAKTYWRMRRFLLKNNAISGFPAPPALIYVPMPRHGASSTNLRKQLEK